MSIKYLLDTNVLSEPLRPRPRGTVLRKLQKHEQKIAIASIVWHELRFGVERLPSSRRRGRGPEVVLTVTNQGPAISRSALPTIFDPFVRAESNQRSKERRGGIGLGLYIARQIVVAHGGTIAVASSEKTGTVFTVRLPRRLQKTA